MASRRTIPLDDDLLSSPINVCLPIERSSPSSSTVIRLKHHHSSSDRRPLLFTAILSSDYLHRVLNIDVSYSHLLFYFVIISLLLISDHVLRLLESPGIYKQLIIDIICLIYSLVVWNFGSISVSSCFFFSFL